MAKIRHIAYRVNDAEAMAKFFIEGFEMKIAQRRGEGVIDLTDGTLNISLLPLGRVGQIHAVQANLRHPGSVAAAVRDADAIVNLVGVLFERGRQRFDAIQAQGAATVAQAAAQFGEALALDRDNGQALAGLAWIRATSADPALRDPAEAVRLAERADALKSHRDVIAIDALAAAYAAAGRFDDAVRVARIGLDQAAGAGQGPVAAQFRQRIELYQKGQPLRVP